MLNSKKMDTMKKSSTWVAMAVAATTIFFSASCRNSKELSATAGETKVVQPFASKEYASDDAYIRYVASEKAGDISVAKSVALIQAQTGLAMLANKEIEGMFTDYLNFKKGPQQNSSVKHVQSLFDGLVQVRMPRVRIIGEELYRDNKTGEYTYYIAAQISVEELEKESLRMVNEEAAIKEVIQEKEYRTLMDQKFRDRRQAQSTSGR
jgi:hypothetical protein